MTILSITGLVLACLAFMYAMAEYHWLSQRDRMIGSLVEELMEARQELEVLHRMFPTPPKPEPNPIPLTKEDVRNIVQELEQTRKELDGRLD